MFENKEEQIFMLQNFSTILYKTSDLKLITEQDSYLYTYLKFEFEIWHFDSVSFTQ